MDLSTELSDALEAAVETGRLNGGGPLRNLERLSSGANNETWLFDWGDTPLILRRRPFTGEPAEAGDDEPSLGLPLADEAVLLQLAEAQQVPVPRVIASFSPGHPLGESYVMTRLPGEALPQRWLAEESLSDVRAGLAHQCGVALARIHRIPTADLPASLPPLSLGQRLEEIQTKLEQAGDVSPVMQLGLNWLVDHAPPEDGRVLVHGDFRTGNLLVDSTGLAGVLDWELAHQGAPAEDLGYLCANVWRFGHLDRPVGGFGAYDDLLAGYAAETGWAPQLTEVRYWEVFAALGWGLVCMTMGQFWQSGLDRGIERAAVARRRSEAELDLLLLMEELDND